MWDLGWHYDCFACFALVFYAAHGEFADSFEDCYHGITCGIVCADLFAFVKSEQGYADCVVLCEGLADYLAWHDLDFSCEVYYFFVFDVFDIWHNVLPF